MAHPRLDTEQLSPDFDDEDDEDSEDGLLSQFDFDAPHWQVLRRLLMPTPTFTTLAVCGFLGLTTVTVSAFLGFVLHPVFNAVAMVVFFSMYLLGFLGLLIVITRRRFSRASRAASFLCWVEQPQPIGSAVNLRSSSLGLESHRIRGTGGVVVMRW